MRIALDAMGGDHSPRSQVEGAISVAREEAGIHIILVGPEDVLRSEIDACGGAPANVSIHHASQVIEASERPLVGVRQKPDASISVCSRLLQAGEASALISSGNTGATVTSASLTLKRLEGVKRPGICTFLPTVDGKVGVIDVGANIKCRPEHLFQYGVMGAIYTQHMLGVDNPRIGLLNIGSEDAKGNELVKNTLRIFSESSVNFQGNIEGQELFMGKVDIVVTDGFVGNTVLKVSEGLAESLCISLAHGYAAAPSRTPEEKAVVIDSVRWLKDQTDYDESGGAPLLGVDGICVISHGRSNAKAITNAIRMTVRFAEKKINEHIVRELKKFVVQV